MNVGTVVGRCGNSGNSSEPHLHFHVQSEPGFELGRGVHPIFDAIQVKMSLKDSWTDVKMDDSPRFPEFVAPAQS